MEDILSLASITIARDGLVTLTAEGGSEIAHTLPVKFDSVTISSYEADLVIRSYSALAVMFVYDLLKLFMRRMKGFTECREGLSFIFNKWRIADLMEFVGYTQHTINERLMLTLAAFQITSNMYETLEKVGLLEDMK
jgi:hypothetical protein